jgi:electron transport complex protein RnfB
MDINILYAALSLGVLGIIFGTALGYASDKFAIEVDPRVPKVREALPGANCGGCGFPGCDAFSEAVVNGEAKVNGCTVGGIKVANALGEILGVKVEKAEKKVAFVNCNGNCSNKKISPDTSGFSNCNDAHKNWDNIASGCSYSCLGLGTCVNVCKFGALDIVDGIAKVNEEKCVNCGACIKACPKGLIESIPENKKVRVVCSSKDAGKIVRINCSVGCIGCKICEKNCPHDAVHVNDLLAKVDYDKCVNCGICVEKCPTKAIKRVG